MKTTYFKGTNDYKDGELTPIKTYFKNNQTHPEKDIIDLKSGINLCAMDYLYNLEQISVEDIVWLYKDYEDDDGDFKHGDINYNRVKTNFERAFVIEKGVAIYYPKRLDSEGNVSSLDNTDNPTCDKIDKINLKLSLIHI